MALDLSQKVGGVPVVAVGGALGVGIIGYSYFKSSRAAAATAVPVGNDTGTPILGAGETTVAAAQTPVPTPTDTNTAWLARALVALTAKGNSPLTVQIALSDYINGNALSVAESKIVNEAISLYGLPPEGVANTPSVTPDPVVPASPTNMPVLLSPTPAPAPAPAQVPAPAPAVNTYTVVPGDTLSGIAMRFYGHGTAVYYMRIAAANGIANPNLIHPGQVLRIP